MTTLRINKKHIILIVCVAVFLFLIATNVLCTTTNNEPFPENLQLKGLTLDLLTQLLNKLHKSEYSHDSDVIQLVEKVSDWKMEFDSKRQIIFVGGVPRSGTTLMRVLLDAHQNISCGQETRIIPRILKMFSQWNKSTKESQRLDEASLDGSALAKVMGVTFMQIFREQSDGDIEHFCNKDPFNLAHISDLEDIFPNARFILMIRDGRAVTHSITTRGITISGIDIKDENKVLGFWNSVCDNMIQGCSRINRKHKQPRCIEVFYEQLILDTESELIRVFKFLGIPWDSRILHHEQMIGNGEIKISKWEPSSKQVSKAIYNESLYKWRSELSPRFLAGAHAAAPLLTRLGYT